MSKRTDIVQVIVPDSFKFKFGGGRFIRKYLEQSFGVNPETVISFPALVSPFCNIIEANCIAVNFDLHNSFTLPPEEYRFIGSTEPPCVRGAGGYFTPYDPKNVSKTSKKNHRKIKPKKKCKFGKSSML